MRTSAARAGLKPTQPLNSPGAECATTTMTDKEINDLKQKRAKAVADAREIHERAKGAALTTEQETQYNSFMAEAAGFAKTIKREEDLRAEAAELNKTGRDLSGDLGEDETRNNENGSASPAKGIHSKEYRADFAQFLTGKLSAGKIQRAHQVGSDVGGGYLVAPPALMADLLKDLDNEVFVRRYAAKVTSGPNGVGQPSLDTDLDDFDWTTELATGSEDEAAFGKRESKPHPMAKRVKISRQLAANSNIEAILRQRLSYKLGVTQEKAYLTGSGAQQPLGVFTASVNGVTTARDISTGNTTTAITFEGLKSARGALKANHRRAARWLFHRDAVTQISKLKDGNGQYIWEVSNKVGEPDVLLGNPVDESEYAPNTFTTGLYVGILANWSYYQILDSLDLQIQMLNELYAETNQIGMIARYEGDGQPTRAEAFARVKLA